MHGIAKGTPVAFIVVFPGNYPKGEKWTGSSWKWNALHPNTEVTPVTRIHTIRRDAGAALEKLFRLVQGWHVRTT
jgi:hypothetical protein